MRREIAQSPVTLSHCVHSSVTTHFARYFRAYPDRKRYQWFIDLCTYGSPIYLQPRESAPRRSKSKNPRFSIRDKLGIGKQLLKWRRKRWVLGPLPLQKAMGISLTINMLFAVPKPDGNSRPILNLADKFLTGCSVNDKLDPAWCTVEYIQQREIIQTLQALGPNAWLWAKDLVDGYYNVSIRKADVAKLGFMFDGKIYLFQVLPMGLASSPRIFTEFMHFPLWAIKHDRPDLYYISVPGKTVNPSHFRRNADIQFVGDRCLLPLIFHYLDDILGGHRLCSKAWTQWDHSEDVLVDLGLQTKRAKDRTPAQIQIWLGKEYNTIKQWVRLSDAKCDKYSKIISDLLDNCVRYVSIHCLQSLVGKIRFMASVYRPLSAFARGLEKYIYAPRRSPDVHVSKNLRRDLKLVLWGLKRARSAGVPWGYFISPSQSPLVTCYTDASGVIGAGGACSNGLFWQHRWSDFTLSKPESRDIVWRELVAIYATILALKDHLGEQLQDRSIAIFTDNPACKAEILKMSAPLYRPDLQCLINDLCKVTLVGRIHLWIDLIAGKDNPVADALSRFKPQPFAAWPQFGTRPFPGRALTGRFRVNTLPLLKRASALSSCWDVLPKYLQWKDPSDEPMTSRSTP